MESEQPTNRWVRRLAGLGVVLGIITLLTLLGMVVRSQELGIAENKSTQKELTKTRDARMDTDDKVIVKLGAEVDRLAKIIEEQNKRVRDKLETLEHNMDKRFQSESNTEKRVK